MDTQVLPSQPHLPEQTTTQLKTPLTGVQKWLASAWFVSASSICFCDTYLMFDVANKTELPLLLQCWGVLGFLMGLFLLDLAYAVAKGKL